MHFVIINLAVCIKFLVIHSNPLLNSLLIRVYYPFRFFQIYRIWQLIGSEHNVHQIELQEESLRKKNRI